MHSPNRDPGRDPGRDPDPDHLRKKYEKMSRELPSPIGHEEHAGFLRAKYDDEAFATLRAPDHMRLRIEQALVDPESFGVERLTELAEYINREASATLTPQVRVHSSYFEGEDASSQYPGLYSFSFTTNFVDDRVIESVSLQRVATRLPTDTVVTEGLVRELPNRKTYAADRKAPMVVLQPGDSVVIDRKLFDDFVFDISNPNDYRAKRSARPPHFADGPRIGGVKNLYRFDREIDWQVDSKIMSAWRNYPAIREVKPWLSFLKTPYSSS